MVFFSRGVLNMFKTCVLNMFVLNIATLIDNNIERVSVNYWRIDKILTIFR